MPRSSSSYFGTDPEGRMRMRVKLPLPPTDNLIYWNNPQGGRTLRKEANAYKRAVRDVVAKLIASSFTEGMPDFIPHVPYEIWLYLYLKAVENETWGQKRGAKSRYKKADLGNRQKLVIDAVMSAIGVDDCHIMKEVLHKRADPDNPSVVVLVREKEARF